MTTHSADVRISLRLGDRTLPVAQLGPDYLILRVAIDYPPCDGEIVLSIDGVEVRWPVRLSAGIQSSRKTQLVEPIAGDAP